MAAPEFRRHPTLNSTPLSVKPHYPRVRHPPPGAMVEKCYHFICMLVLKGLVNESVSSRFAKRSCLSISLSTNPSSSHSRSTHMLGRAFRTAIGIGAKKSNWVERRWLAD
jgi:hypothetical protein